MKKSKNSKHVSELAQARRRFDSWRESCGPGPRRIPEPLWRVAVRLVAKHGLHLTSRSLRVNYMALKAQAAKRGGLPPSSKPVFVEVAPAGAPLFGGSLIELEKSGGAKVRVQLKAGEALDITALMHSFWETGA